MDPLLVRLQRGLASRYTVEHELGRGGMAVVYLGRDLRLDRRVAIKVFETGSSASADERFLREIRVAARLQHPNILPVFESGETEGLVFYVMPYVAGASLRDRIEREGPLPIADAVRIGREVAEALDHAHRAGTVHRDIKPDNIMLADGVAVVADFGIARAIVERGDTLTAVGAAIGTPNYMSPEQGAGMQQVDGRTDIYALGCVLYEMLAGTPPFAGASAQIVMARHATDVPPPLQSVRPIPPTLETVVTKALAKLPGDRWPSGRAMAGALSEAVPTQTYGSVVMSPARRRMRWIAAALAVPAIVAIVLWRMAGSASAGDGRFNEPLQSVAVLPIVARDSSLAAIADGLTESIITGLVRLEGLRVPSSSRVFAVKDRQADLQAIGRELGVGAVMSASLQQEAGVLRINAQLVSVADGRILWSQHYDGQLGSMFAMQDTLTGQIVDALLPRLPASRRAATIQGVRTRDTLALRLYLEGRRAAQTITRSGRQRGVELLQEALRRDSNYADAWVALAEAHSFGPNEQPPAQRALIWRQALEHAIGLDSTNGYAFALRGLLHEYEWDLPAARRDYQRAMQLSPASADAAMMYAVYLETIGDRDSVLVYAHRIVTLDPTSAVSWDELGKRFARAGMPDSALAASLRAAEMDTTYWVPNWVLMNVYLDKGRRAEADRAALRLQRLSGGASGALLLASAYYRRAGDRKDAQRILDTLSARARREYVSPSTLGGARLAVGDTAGALAGLEESVRNHDFRVAQDLALIYSPLKRNPRYEAASRTVYGSQPVPTNPFP